MPAAFPAVDDRHIPRLWTFEDGWKPDAGSSTLETPCSSATPTQSTTRLPSGSSHACPFDFDIVDKFTLVVPKAARHSVLVAAFADEPRRSRDLPCAAV